MIGVEKKNFFVRNKTFTIFGFLGIVIVLIAIFAPVVTGGIDPTTGSLSEALQPPGDLDPSLVERPVILSSRMNLTGFP